MSRRGRSERRRSNAVPQSSAVVGQDSGLFLLEGGVDARSWDKWLAAVPYSTLEQAWAYGDAMEGVSPYHAIRLTFWPTSEPKSGDLPVAIAQAHEWRLLGLRIVKLTRGPLFLTEADDDLRRAALRLIKKRWRLTHGKALFWTPELENAAGHEDMRSLGMRRVITGYHTPVLDLSPPLEYLRRGLHGNWRNQLKAAEKSRLKLKVAKGGLDLDTLLMHHERDRKKRRFPAASAAFTKLMIDLDRDRNVATVHSAWLAGEMVAGVLIIRHGRTAVNFMAWSGKAGRALNAGNLLLWTAIGALKEQGVDYFDLGGVDGRAMPGISRFKMGLGGRLVGLSGTYL